MDCKSIRTADQIAKSHEGMPEELLMRMAASALRAVDIICEVCQGKIDAPSETGGAEI